MNLVNEIDYSVLICTYNPDERLFKRCLNAVNRLSMQDLVIEVIVVDNNSNIPLSSLGYIKQFLKGFPNSQLIVVKEQGLVHARIAGISLAKGSNIIFFDDDNEPDIDYLQELKRLNHDHENVAAWGPGNIAVDFIDGIDGAIEEYAKAAFQYRHEDRTTFANIRSWQDCYPFGTGLCIKATLLKSFNELVRKKIFSMVGRTGDSMGSGEDTQIVLFCVEQGYAAGVSPGLRLMHIIPGKRANFGYLKRLTFGTSVCYSSVIMEVFPDKIQEIKNEIPKRTKLMKLLLKGYYKVLVNPNQEKVLKFINLLAAIKGRYVALDLPVPTLLIWVIGKMNI